MPQDSSFCSNSTLGSSASHISEKSNKKAAAIVPDMSGNFFVLNVKNMAGSWIFGSLLD